MKNSTESTYVLIMLLYLYLFFSQLFAMYFFWEYLQDHSFLDSLLFGAVAAEIKGLLFPLFI